MQGHPFVAAPGARSAPPWRLVLSILLVLAAVTVPLQAQSVLGTIRGTVTDPQGGAVPAATVLITDEATGVPRTLETNAEGFYEASNLRPGTYRVEIVTTSFKKYEQPGVVVRTGAAQRVDAKLELGSLTETVTVSAEAINNIVAGEPGGVAWASTRSSCATCRATAATCSPSCC